MVEKGRECMFAVGKMDYYLEMHKGLG